MELYGQSSRSIPQKTVILALESLILACSYVILFKGKALIPFLATPDGDLWRRECVFAFNCIVYLRMWITIAYLVRRKIPWEEAIGIPLAFAVYYIGFSLLVLHTHHPFDGLDVAGIVIYLLGAFLNTASELQRDSWKKDPAHKGKLYTGGLFGLSMHINYFGDLLWVSGYAIITRNPWAALIPLMLFCLFAFYNIPKLDAYLAEKYGEQFTSYRAGTKRFIPFLY